MGLFKTGGCFNTGSLNLPLGRFNMFKHSACCLMMPTRGKLEHLVEVFLLFGSTERPQRGVYKGLILQGTTTRLIEADTRSLDYGSYVRYAGLCGVSKG